MGFDMHAITQYEKIDKCQCYFNGEHGYVVKWQQ